MVSAVWSVSFLLFFHSRCPQYPAICKSGGTWGARVPRAPWSRRHWPCVTLIRIGVVVEQIRLRRSVRATSAMS